MWFIKGYTVCYLYSRKYFFVAYISPDGTWTNFIIMMTVMVIANVTAFLVTNIFGKKTESRI